MFEKNKCPRCDFFVKQSWNFCPHCGINLKQLPSPEPEPMPLMIHSGFKELDMTDVFKDLNKMLQSMMGEEPIKGSVSITRLGGPSGPKIDVKTSGDYKKIEPEIKKKLGVKKKFSGKSKTTEEPAINVKEMPHEDLIEIKLPGIKNEDDIEIIQLEQSIEVRAFAKDKAYFKLIPIPENIKSIGKELKKEVLVIRLKK